jgi:hypothetical protein
MITRIYVSIILILLAALLGRPVLADSASTGNGDNQVLNTDSSLGHVGHSGTIGFTLTIIMMIQRQYSIGTGLGSTFTKGAGYSDGSFSYRKRIYEVVNADDTYVADKWMNTFGPLSIPANQNSLSPTDTGPSTITISTSNRLIYQIVTICDQGGMFPVESSVASGKF